MDSPVPMLPSDVKDPYDLLGLDRHASDKDVRRAYRRKARHIHPDKNPDDPAAQVKFHRLQCVYEFLIHKTARCSYDEKLVREEERKARFAKFDATRKRFAEELERRERESGRNTAPSVSSDKTTPASHRPAATAPFGHTEEHHEAREATKRWIEEKQRQMQQQTCDGSMGRSTKVSQEHGYVEITWKTHRLVPGDLQMDVSPSSLQFNFSPFGFCRVLGFDAARGSCVVELNTRERAVEAALHFLKNKDKYAFFVKLKRNLSGVSNIDQKCAFSKRVPPPKPVEFSPSNTRSDPSPLSSALSSLDAFETSVMDRLKAAVRS